jgi:hypothetical protein
MRRTPIIPAGFITWRALERTPAGEQIYDQDNDRDDEDEVNQRAANVTDEAEKPENHKNDENCPEHIFFPSTLSFLFFVAATFGALIPATFFKSPTGTKHLAKCGGCENVLAFWHVTGVQRDASRNLVRGMTIAFRFPCCLALTVLLAGCASRGTVVSKSFRALPFSESLGLDALYKLELRDENNRVHSQLVTPEVFRQYRVGDYFDDLHPAQRAVPAQVHATAEHHVTSKTTSVHTHKKSVRHRLHQHKAKKKRLHKKHRKPVQQKPDVRVQVGLRA